MRTEVHIKKLRQQTKWQRKVKHTGTQRSDNLTKSDKTARRNETKDIGEKRETQKVLGQDKKKTGHSK